MGKSISGRNNRPDFKALAKTNAEIKARKDVAERLHDATHNLNMVLSPAVGPNGRWQITWLSPTALGDGGNS